MSYENESPELKEVRDTLMSTFPKLFTDRDVIWLPKGWLPLVISLSTDIQDKLSTQKITVAQVKEKFGRLRFYLDRDRESKLTFDDRADIWAKISQAEEDSMEICQHCGSRDNVETAHELAVVKTLCCACRVNIYMDGVKKLQDTL